MLCFWHFVLLLLICFFFFLCSCFCFCFLFVFLCVAAVAPIFVCVLPGGPVVLGSGSCFFAFCVASDLCLFACVCRVFCFFTLQNFTTETKYACFLSIRSPVPHERAAAAVAVDATSWWMFRRPEPKSVSASSNEVEGGHSHG